MAFENIHNYYEMLVAERIRQTAGTGEDEDFHEDVACVALNQLPPRYVRHTVDLAFYMSADERQRMHQAVDEAVQHAVDFVRAHRRDHPRQTDLGEADIGA